MNQQKSSFIPGLSLRFAFLLCLFCSGTFLQAQLFEWAKRFGAQDRTQGYEIAVDSNNHVITTGVFRNMVDFDPGSGVFNLTPGGISGRDVYISKLDSAGDFIWAKQLACVSALGPGSIAIDDTGNVYITGAFPDTIDVDPGPNVLNFVPRGNIDAYVIKLNPMGEFEWGRQIGDSSGNVIASGITVDREGFVYTTGGFFDTVDFDPGPDTLRLNVASGFSFTSAGYVLKLDASGNFVWAKSLGGTGLGSTQGNSIAVDENSNVYTGGVFDDVQDFDPGIGSFTLSSVGDDDVFISKLDSTGGIVWAKQFSGSLNKNITDIKIGSNQTVYGTGLFRGAVDFDPGPDTLTLSSLGGFNGYVCKLDSLGDFLWTQGFLGTSDVTGEGIYLDGEENVYVTGSFRQTMDSDPGPDTVSFTAAGARDIYICKLDVNGQYAWSVQMGGATDDVPLDIALDRQANLYTTGFFQGIADFDPGAGVFNLTASGIADAFVHRLSVCEPTLGSLTVSTCDSYTSPSGDSTWTQSGMYTDIIANLVGCDSLISIDLTILNSTSDTLSAVVCDSFVSPSGNHIWTSSGTYLDTIPNAIGCDSLLTINLSVNNTFTNLSPTACDTYLSPGGKTLTASGTYLDTIPNTAGCDSLLTINLTLNNSTTSTISPTACGIYLSPGGKSLTTSGTYLDTIPNTTGCDSLITIDLTLNNTTTGTISPTACGTYLSPGGNSLTTSGTYLDTLPNTAGCDSLLTINLTVLNSTANTITPTVCDTYLSPAGRSLTTSGTYTDTLLNAAGCDSLITIDLTVNTTTSSTIAPTACDMYLSPAGRSLTTSGTYLDTLPNAAGCDSLITINLSIDTVDVTVVNNSPSLMANASGAIYQWLDCNDGFALINGATTQNFLPTANGSYAVEISQGVCLDTSACEVVGNVAMLNNEFGSDLILYPNPTQDKIVIEFGKSYDEISLSLHNQFGQALWHRYYGTVHRIEFPLVEVAGVYLLSIRAGEKAAQLKVIKI